MIPSLVHLVMAMTLGVLTVLASRIWRWTRRTPTLIVAVVLAGLTYDNAVLGLGHWLDHGPVLHALSLPRFLLHAATTPLLIVVGLGAARAAGFEWAETIVARAGFWLLTAAIVVWGAITDVALLELVAEREGGVVGYGNADAGLPVPALVTIAVLVAVGILLWRRAMWPWLAVGSLLMLVASALGPVSELLTNIGELALAVSLVATEREAGVWAASTKSEPQGVV